MNILNKLLPINNSQYSTFIIRDCSSIGCTELSVVFFSGISLIRKWNT